MPVNGFYPDAGKTVIDIRSDTVSQPSKRMREAMANAVVGDDVYNEDPTVLELEQQCAKLFEKEAALFVTSGTMGNLLAIMVHCNFRGAEAIIGDLSHVFLYEQGGAATIANVLLSPIKNNADGTFSLAEMKKRIRGADCYHEPKTTLAIVENTHNICGGRTIPLDWLDEFVKMCDEHGLAKHMDGARIFNAAADLNVPVARITRDFDSMTFCLSKGLCAPVGSILIGTKEFIKKARTFRKLLGGGMRQSGHLAAAALVALEDNVPPMHEVHERTKRIAEAIANLRNPYISCQPEDVQTNICMISMPKAEKYSAAYLTKRLQEVTDDELKAGVKDSAGNGIVVKVMGRPEWNSIRIVLYNNIDSELTDLAIAKFKYCINEMI